MKVPWLFPAVAGNESDAQHRYSGPSQLYRQKIKHYIRRRYKLSLILQYMYVRFQGAIYHVFEIVRMWLEPSNKKKKDLIQYHDLFATKARTLYVRLRGPYLNPVSVSYLLPPSGLAVPSINVLCQKRFCLRQAQSLLFYSTYLDKSKITSAPPCSTTNITIAQPHLNCTIQHSLTMESAGCSSTFILFRSGRRRDTRTSAIS